MSLLLLFNSLRGVAPGPVIVQSFPMGDHGVTAIVAFGGQVAIIGADGTITVAGDGKQVIIVDDGVNIAMLGSGIKTGID